MPEYKILWSLQRSDLCLLFTICPCCSNLQHFAFYHIVGIPVAYDPNGLQFYLKILVFLNHWSKCSFFHRYYKRIEHNFILRLIIHFYSSIISNILGHCVNFRVPVFLNLNKPNYLQVEDTGSEGATGDHRSTNRQRRRKVRVPRTVVNPDENFYFYWLWVITACVLYNLWTLIVRQSFPELQVRIIHHPIPACTFTIELKGWAEVPKRVQVGISTYLAVWKIKK